MRCGDCYHSSCAKLTSKIKFVGADAVVCCAPSDGSYVSDTITCDDAIMCNEKIKSLPDNPDVKQMFNYIIYQKDVIIKELYDKIDLLQDKIRLLDAKTEEKRQADNDGSKTKTTNIDIPSNDKSTGCAPNNCKSAWNNGKTVFQTTSKQRTVVTHRQLNAALMQAQQEGLCREIITLTSDESNSDKQASLVEGDDNYKLVQRRRQKHGKSTVKNLRVKAPRG